MQIFSMCVSFKKTKEKSWDWFYRCQNITAEIWDHFYHNKNYMIIHSLAVNTFTIWFSFFSFNVICTLAQENVAHKIEGYPYKFWFLPTLISFYIHIQTHTDIHPVNLANIQGKFARIFAHYFISLLIHGFQPSFYTISYLIYLYRNLMFLCTFLNR